MTCHRIFQDRQECITVIGITGGGYPATDNSGRRVLSGAAGCGCGRHRVPGTAWIDYALYRTHCLITRGVHKQAHPWSSVRSLTVDGGPSPRSIAYLPDRTPLRRR